MIPEDNGVNNAKDIEALKKQKKQKEIADQAKGARVAFDVLEKIPVTSGVGAALKKADKFTGGMVSNTVGKINRLSPKAAQFGMKTLGKVGTALSIKEALNKKNKVSGTTVKSGSNGKSLSPNLKNTKSPTEKIQNSNEESAGGVTNFVVSSKGKTIAFVFSMIGIGVIIFCCLLVAGPQIYLNSITLGNADNSSSEEIDKKISRTPEDKFDEEITDEKLENTTGYNFGKTIKRKTYASPYILASWKKKKRKYNEADLAKLEDFYGRTLTYNDKTAYDFYYKLHDIYVRYSSLYDVELDLPLLMATLMLESKDMSVIFESNTSDDSYDYTTIKNKSIDHILDYHYDWSSKGYKISSKSSAHDIEILAQNMVSIDSNGKYIIDNDKYKEFLKEFLEKKYFLADGGLYEGKSDNKVNNLTDKDGNYVGDLTFVNSNFGDVVYYNQGDYANYYYSSDPSSPQYYQDGEVATIKSHGCGPVSLAIVLSSILNKQITPIEATKVFCSAGGCTSGGSYHDKIVPVAQSYGVNSRTTANNQEVLDALATNNSLVIVLMGPGVFTPTGHFIVLTGVDSSGQVSVADPGSRAKTNQKWFPFNTIVEQRKTKADYMIFSR